MSTDLSEIRAALAAATPGPWAVAQWHQATVMPKSWADDLLPVAERGRFMTAGVSPDADAKDPLQAERDAHLIANAPSWLAYLVQRVKAAEAERDAAREDLEVADGLAVMYADLRDEALGNAMEAEAALTAIKATSAFTGAVGPWPIEQGVAHTHRWGLVAPGSDSRSQCQRCGVLR